MQLQSLPRVELTDVRPSGREVEHLLVNWIL